MAVVFPIDGVQGLVDGALRDEGVCVWIDLAAEHAGDLLIATVQREVETGPRGLWGPLGRYREAGRRSRRLAKGHDEAVCRTARSLSR